MRGPIHVRIRDGGAAAQRRRCAAHRGAAALCGQALLVGLGYADFHYASYYLLGEQWQEARHSYAVNYFRQDEFLEYFRHGIPITLNAQRLNTPTGLTVYVQDWNIVEQFQGAGLIATPVEHGLWRMDGTAGAYP